MQSSFIDACFRRPVERIPAWIMRQAGRYQPSYRALRQKHSFWEMCTVPELACQVTVAPIDQFDLDAAILFSDILAPVPAMGLDVAFSPGPVIGDPVRSRAQVDALSVPDPERDFPWQAAAVRATLDGLAGRVPLIGFCGAPFTLGAYLVEGMGSKNFAAYRELMRSDRAAFDALMDKLTQTLARTLEAQIAAGAQAVQIFESWASLLGPTDYEELVLPWVCKLVETVRTPGVPIIYYANGAFGFLERLPETGADVLGIDWRVSLGRARELVGPEVALQGNLDPTALFLPDGELAARARQVAQSGADHRGYIFNLGHGILPTVQPERVTVLLEAVHSASPAK
jgi:uroporphyrinogen decarboxylase